MKVLRQVPKLQAELDRFRRAGLTVGFVPTMGALHAGHARLITRARKTSGAVVVSIFVNPLQFGPREDLSRYPRTLAADLKTCRAAGADLVFVPEAKTFLKMKSLVRVPAPPLKKYLCGAFRPGHFDGVTAIVAHLFRIVKPDDAFFGLKDYQQFRVIEEMTRARFGGRPRIIPVPTARERDGLAMSSRNRYLTPEERAKAPALHLALARAARRLRRGGETIGRVKAALREDLERDGIFKAQYAEISDARSLKPLRGTPAKRGGGRVVIAAAVFLGPTRLIDNVLV